VKRPRSLDGSDRVDVADLEEAKASLSNGLLEEAWLCFPDEAAAKAWMDAEIASKAEQAGERQWQPAFLTPTPVRLLQTIRTGQDGRVNVSRVPVRIVRCRCVSPSHVHPKTSCSLRMQVWLLAHP